MEAAFAVGFLGEGKSVLTQLWNLLAFPPYVHSDTRIEAASSKINVKAWGWVGYSPFLIRVRWGGQSLSPRQHKCYVGSTKTLF